MIKAVEIEGFRSIRSMRFELRPLNVLIGPNQSGKTNILDALDLLANAVQGKLRHSLYQARGGLTNVLWAGNGPRQIHYRVEFKAAGQFSKDGGALYELTIGKSSQGHKVSEEIIRTGPKHGKSYARSNMRMLDVNLELYNAREKKENHLKLREIQLLEPVISQFRDAGAYPTLEKIRETLGATSIYPGFATKSLWACDDPSELPQIRQPQYVQFTSSLSPSGDNLVNVLYTLSQDHERWEQFKEDIRIGFPDLENIIFPPDAGQGRISLAWVDRRFPKKRFPAEVLSAGTLSFLAVAALFSSTEPKALIGIDEPEAHLHPELLYRLVGLMEKASARRQLIVTTHSDALLSYLSDPTDVVLVSNGPQGTTLTRPPEDDLRAWLKDYSLGQLREAGHLAAFAPEE